MVTVLNDNDGVNADGVADDAGYGVDNDKDAENADYVRWGDDERRRQQ